ncbi:MAG: TRAP transporter small permease [Methylobacteriaceae bacterium]|jgi:TRAP-type C4-dicarboxylate transport system permease small subunit|nr:TRAP transporter small permease [Methylobacteriaceae bacterium]
MESLRKKVDFVLANLCIALMSLMVILVTYQVIVRYAFNDPSVFSESMCNYAFIWLVMLGSAYVFGQRGHMNIPVVRDMTPRRVQIVIDLLGEVIILVFALMVMGYGGYLGASAQMAQRESILPIQMGVIYSAIPLAALFVVFYFFFNCKQLLAEFNTADAAK